MEEEKIKWCPYKGFSMKFQVIVHAKGRESHSKSSLCVLEKIGPHFNNRTCITGSTARITCAAHTAFTTSAKLNQRGTYTLRGTLGNERSAYSLEPENGLETHQIAQSSLQFSR